MEIDIQSFFIIFEKAELSSKSVKGADMKLIPSGIENFKELIDGNYYYVDKTNLISDAVKEKVVLYTRPRRFGKTLNMSMLYYFFSNKETENKYLFDGLNISKNTEALKHQNQYPVIFVSLKEMKNMSFSSQIASFKNIVYEIMEKNQQLLSSILLTDTTKEILNRLHTRTADIEDLKSAFRMISNALYTHYQEKVIILIDEYDVPLQAAYQYGYYDEMVDFIRSVFSSALKTNDALEKGIMTGCLRISRESIFTGLNNFSSYSILDSTSDEFFGFTEKEVKEMLSAYQLEDCIEEVKDWYDGYKFGNIEIYNPWSTLMYIKNKTNNRDNKPVSYWANTSGNDLVVRYIESGDRTLKQDFEVLMDGGSLVKVIRPELTYREMDNINNIYSFLLLTGYLKAIEDMGENRYRLVIPNKEVYEIYKQSFMSYFEDYRSEKKGLLYEALTKGETEKVNVILNDILLKSISYYDNAESFYHGFLVGVLKDYELKSNREAGEGRFDICVYPDTILGTAVIIECKHSEGVRYLKKDAEEGTEQIKEKKYMEEIQEEGYSNVIGYGISFCKKQCYVKKA